MFLELYSDYHESCLKTKITYLNEGIHCPNNGRAGKNVLINPRHNFKKKKIIYLFINQNSIVKLGLSLICRQYAWIPSKQK